MTFVILEKRAHEHDVLHRTTHNKHVTNNKSVTNKDNTANILVAITLNLHESA